MPQNLSNSTNAPSVNIEIDGNILHFYMMNHAKVVSDFIRCMKKCVKKGIKSYILEFSKVHGIFPNAAVPISGIIDNLRNCGYTFEFRGMSAPMEISKFSTPEPYIKTVPYIMSRVWKFQTHEEVGILVDAFIEELRKEDRFGEGVLMSLGWSLNEVMDNVLVHSGANYGYVMGQIHKNSKNIAFSVFDLGMGIYNSFKKSIHRPRTSIDAITLAIKEEVTRDKKVGQGNGLFGLNSVITQGNGKLEIISSGASYLLNKGDQTNFIHLPCWNFKTPGTIVDFQINYGSELSLAKALVFRGQPYELINLFIENLEDDRGNVIYCIDEHVEGTGTRESAIRAKNEIINILHESKNNVILDFSKISLISSSFADELIAKLLLELGLFQFNNVIKLKGLTFEQQKILQRSVIQRMVDSLEANGDDDNISHQP